MCSVLEEWLSLGITALIWMCEGGGIYGYAGLIFQ